MAWFIHTFVSMVVVMRRGQKAFKRGALVRKKHTHTHTNCHLERRVVGWKESIGGLVGGGGYLRGRYLAFTVLLMLGEQG